MTILSVASLIVCLVIGLWLLAEARRWVHGRQEAGLDAYPNARLTRRVASALLLLGSLVAANWHEALQSRVGLAMEILILGAGLICALTALFILVRDLQETRRATDQMIGEVGRGVGATLKMAVEMELKRMPRESGGAEEEPHPDSSGDEENRK